jgi:hypothetical protein
LRSAPASGVASKTAMQGANMKSYTRRMIAILGLAAMTIGAGSGLNAQSSETTANVPFAFTAGTASLPRGAYHLSTLPGHTDALMIRSFQHGAILLSQPAGSTPADSTPRLVFDRYGDRYFLREIRLAGNVGFEFPKTAAENAAAERIASGAKPEVVVVRMGQQ